MFALFNPHELFQNLNNVFVYGVALLKGILTNLTIHGLQQN